MACTLWVLARARDEGLKKLERVPAGVRVVVGDTAEAFDGQPPADAIFVCSMGRELLRAVLPKAPGARWVHSRSVGVENILFPGLAESGVTLTNGRGVFSPSLAEWVIAAVLFFAKDLRRLVKSQEHLRLLRIKSGGLIEFDHRPRTAALGGVSRASMLH